MDNNMLDEKFNALKELLYSDKFDKIEALEYKLDKILFILERLDKKIDNFEKFYLSIKNDNKLQNKEKKSNFEEFGLIQETLF